MIEKALLHLPQIGFERIKQLHDAGIFTWTDIVNMTKPVVLSQERWDMVRYEAENGLRALAGNDIGSLVKMLKIRDHWRILAHYLDRASYLDIETSGLEADADITVVACFHQENLHYYVKDINLVELLELLESLQLLVTFNGSSFDLPRIVRHFNIPEFPCAHVDMRWLAYYQNLSGGLKAIERRSGIFRPDDLYDVDGEEALCLWQMWDLHKNEVCLKTLLRYCGADVITLNSLIPLVLPDNPGIIEEPDWTLLDSCEIPAVKEVKPLSDNKGAKQSLKNLMRRRR